ncbi:hypothetical protein HW132_20220 [Brasilonema sp. CT11]|nr:hypothetical protein [Brasilonema sp. CT11]
MPDNGIRLELRIGRPTAPVLASYEVVDALIDLEVTQQDRERSGFQMTFSLGRQLRNYSDYWLLREGILDPPNRVILTIIVGVLVGVNRPIKRQILIDGIITNHQIAPSNQPGESRLIVTGEDISLKLDLKEKSTTYENQSDSQIVTKILQDYSQYWSKTDVQNSEYTPTKEKIITTQQGTDLKFIQQLAERNSFIFEIKPSNTLGKNIVYWGEEKRNITPYQPALSMNMGAFTNVDSISFSFNALNPTEPQVEIVDDINGQPIPVKIPSSPGQALASEPAKALRQTILRSTNKLDLIPAQRYGESVLSRFRENAVTASGEVDTVRYGHILQVRQLVGVRGVGKSYGGYYYVKQVTHRIKRGEYKQSFTLIREGRGATTQRVEV